MTGSLEASLAHLHGRLTLIERRIRDAVERRRAGDPRPDDPFRGLYLPDDVVDRLLEPRSPLVDGADVVAGTDDDVEREAAAAEARGEEIRLRKLSASFGLTPLDTELLLIAMAPDLDPRIEKLYGYLHDDVTRRRASIGLALELAGSSPLSSAARGRLEGEAPLISGGLMALEEVDRPFLTRALRVPDRVTTYLLGSNDADPLLAPFLLSPADHDVGEPEGLARALRAGTMLCYLRGGTGTPHRAVAARAVRLAGMEPLSIDLSVLQAEDAAVIAGVAGREARLRGAALIAGPLESLLEQDRRAIRFLTELPTPVLLHGTPAWDPAWSRTVPLVVEVHPLSVSDRRRVWEAALDGSATFDPTAATAAFRLDPDQISRAARSAELAAIFSDSPLDPGLLHQGTRAQNAAVLERLARRITPSVSWDDMVLPADTLTQLRGIGARVRHAETVLTEWGMGEGARRRTGVTTLFAGESGTGKTMAAEALAGDLGLDLYAIDLSTVVDKYIGETEKNLDRVFDEASGVNGVLFFDEADALFGKRSEVRDAHDRYANVEVAYLLQRMESFDGIAILATNLRANIDDAFARRLDVVVDFPMPDEAGRRELWNRCLGPDIPRSDDLDLEFCAKAFELSGGNIRNAVMAAAYLAAEAESPVSMAHLIRGVELEYQKLGRLSVASEFGPYFGLLRAAGA